MLERMHEPHLVSFLGQTAAELKPESWTAVVRCTLHLLCQIYEATMISNDCGLKSDLSNIDENRDNAC